MIFNTATPAAGGSSSWTSLDFSDIFAGSDIATHYGTFLTNGQLVYVSCRDIQSSDLIFGASAYAPSDIAWGSGYSANDALPVFAYTDASIGFIDFYLPDGSTSSGADFTIIYPIA